MSALSCPGCGHGVERDTVFCPFCGLPQSHALTQAPPQEPPARRTAFSPATPAVRYASFWPRFAAIVIDHVLITLATWMTVLPVALALGAGASESTQETAAGLIYVALAIAFPWLYEAYFMSSARQATLGKTALGLIVTDDAGRRITFGRATGRHFAKYLSAMVLAIGYLIQPFSERRQALHDMLAGTLVLKR